MSQFFIRELLAAVASAKPDVRRNGPASEPDGRTLETFWRDHGAVGKGESGYGPIYAEIIGDLPPR